MFDWLLNIDHELFSFLNGLHSNWMDPIQYWISYKFFWIPLYAFLLYRLIKFYKIKALLIIVLITGLVASTDQLSGLSKRSVERYRPCKEESSHRPRPHLVNNHCGGAYGFYSAHASSSFALAIFLGTLLIPVFKNARKYLLIWAFFVSYSRVYLGVHYPSDIFIGALVGIEIGVLFFSLYSIFERKFFVSS